MHLQKHSNPHIIADATKIVSRKVLQFQDNSDGDVEQNGAVDAARPDIQEIKNLRVTLDRIVSKRLKLKRKFTPSDEPHSRKRHKASAEEVEPQQRSEPVGELVSQHSPRMNHRYSP